MSYHKEQTNYDSKNANENCSDYQGHVDVINPIVESQVLCGSMQIMSRRSSTSVSPLRIGNVAQLINVNIRWSRISRQITDSIINT